MRSFPEELVPALGERACAACVERFVAQVEKERQQRERKREHDRWCRTCAICAREFEQVLPQCNVCGRPVCPEHRIRYRKQFRFGAHKGQEAAWYWDYDVRCRDHKRSPWLVRLQGWEIDPTDGQDTP
ncbi:MAG TPA: hypothetical protein EYH31_07035 [Anaerolineae bacterium]|nr:hypothetical protein [Anaerolineae bacterium]